MARTTPSADRWTREPLYGEGLGSQDLVGLWASLAIGLPLLWAGARLVAPEAVGGFGLTTPEFVIAAVGGIGIGGLLLGLVGWAGATVAVPTGLLLRPAFGTWGGGALSVLVVVGLGGIAGFELRTAAAALANLIGEAGGPDHVALGWAIAVAVTLAMLWAGPAVIARTWIRRGAFWAALLVTIFLLARITTAEGFGSPDADAGRLWEALDFIVGVAVLWFPLAPEIARFSGAPGIAGTAIGGGFAVPAFLVLMTGAGVMTAMQPDGSLDTVDLVLGLAAGTIGAALAVLVIVWLLVSELDQPFGLLYAAGSTLAALRSGWGQRLTSVVLLAGAAAAGALVPRSEFGGWLALLISIFVPAVAVFIADFFVVRDRSYNTDAIVEGAGTYRGMNLLGVGALLLGIAVYQVLVPAGPSGWVAWLRDLLPEGEGLTSQVVAAQPGFVSFLVAFAVYTLFARWVTPDDASITRISGRF